MSLTALLSLTGRMPTFAKVAAIGLALPCGMPAAAVWARTVDAGEMAAGADGLDERASQVRQHAIEFIKRAKLPGMSIAVVDDGRIVWAEGFGVRRQGQDEPVDSETLFQAASISKPVAALCALRLVERGALDLDADVNEKLRSWQVPANDFTAQQPVTLRFLLCHAAGLTVHGFPGYVMDAELPSLVDILDGTGRANTDPVRVDMLPGQQMRYSGGGFTVMQLMLADVTKRPFDELMRSEVIEPLGMSHSTYQQPLPEAWHENAARGHRVDGSIVSEGWHVYPEQAAAGLWTTPSDLARVLMAIQRAYGGRHGSIISSKTAHEMLTPQVSDMMGLGLRLMGDGTATRFAHGGANEGFRCQMVGLRDRPQGAVVMTNWDLGSAALREMFRKFAEVYEWPAIE